MIAEGFGPAGNAIAKQCITPNWQSARADQAQLVVQYASHPLRNLPSVCHFMCSLCASSSSAAR